MPNLNFNSNMLIQVTDKPTLTTFVQFVEEGHNLLKALDPKSDVSKIFFSSWKNINNIQSD